MQLKYIGILVILSFPLIGLTSVIIFSSGITPNDQFFVVTKGITPEINVSNWTLTIDGHVNQTLHFTYSNITSLPSTEVLATLQCVDGPSGTAIWKGVRVKELLDLAVIKNGAVDMVFYGADDYSSSLTIEESGVDDVLLAYEMNSEALPVDQGYPVRIVAPNQLGYKWVKWVVRIEIVTYDYIGYWETRGWNDDASITPLSNWILHAILLSISFFFGGIAIMSGLRNSPATDFFRELPKWMNKKFHIIIGAGFFISSLGIFFYWITSTILNRGAVFYTVHGILALISMGLLLFGIFTSLKKQKKRDINHKTWHYKLTVYSFYLFIFTIILGFMLMFINFGRLY